jgi:hydroxyacylglutathione hydrolase
MNEITVKELREKHYDIIIDVRTQEEFDRGHVPGAKHLELSHIHTWCKKLKKEKIYYIICKSGRRSGIACTMLVGIGFEKCYNVSGGTDAWLSEGYEIE